ncbi:hypothetical protein MAM1_0300c09418 [Mucor ambiguus]|uniref:Uncharacterized protein n=1 Tax=Mucor ambiguus TaxID=91626 RepID=A0A0C9LXA4_9FUNG|nr:hypothetical protein MAM1_0300c09418 [Mucor ambiguus]
MEGQGAILRSISMDHRQPLIAIRNVFRATSFIGLIISIIFFLKPPKDSVFPSSFYLPEQIFSKKCQYIQNPTIELLPEALHPEELTSTFIRLLVFPRYNMTASYCPINQFGLTVYNRAIYIYTESNYFTKSPLTENLLSESNFIVSKRRTSTLIYLFTTTKHAWMYLLFVVIRYHQTFRAAISSSALPPYDTIFQKCLEAYQNCEKLENAVFQMFLIYKRHMTEHTRLRYLEYSKRLNRSDILPAASNSKDTLMNSANSENDVKEATQAGGSTAATSTCFSVNAAQSKNLGNVYGAGKRETIYRSNKEDVGKDVDEGPTQYSSSDNGEEGSTNSNSGKDDNDSKGDIADSIATPAPNNTPEDLDFLVNRLDSFGDTKKPSRIPLLSVHGKNKKVSSQDHRSLRGNLYLQGYIDNQQLEAIPEAEEGPDHVEEESESELEDNEQPADVQNSNEQQYYTEHNNISNYHQSFFAEIQRDWPLQVNETAIPQRSTFNTLSSSDLYSSVSPTPTVSPHQTSNINQSYSSDFIPIKESPFKAHVTISRSASGRRGGNSQASSSGYYNNPEEQASSSRADSSEDNGKEEAIKLQYSVQSSLSEAQINSLADLEDFLKYYEINLL